MNAPAGRPPRSSDEWFQALHAPGWTSGDLAYLDRRHGVPVLVWLVIGTRGEDRIRAEGRTRGDAWRAAVRQARAVGMNNEKPVPASGRVERARALEPAE